MELLLGCGRKRNKEIGINGSKGWTKLVTLDIDPEAKPDVVWDMTKLPLPFEDETFNEIHAYEVLEHTGQQGDYKFFFAQFSDFWRILKPQGLIMAHCPKWDSWAAWGDPGHTRIIGRGQLTYLNQPAYTDQIGKTSMTDYRPIYKADFNIVFMDEEKSPELFNFALQAIKPSRITEQAPILPPQIA